MCGGPPNGACMHMTFEKIDPPRKIPEGLEHPAAQAAKIIKQLHLDTIAKADAGFVFEKDGKDVTSSTLATSRSISAIRSSHARTRCR